MRAGASNQANPSAVGLGFLLIFSFCYDSVGVLIKEMASSARVLSAVNLDLPHGPSHDRAAVTASCQLPPERSSHDARAWKRGATCQWVALHSSWEGASCTAALWG